MEYMVVWLHDFTDTYYSVHGLDQIDDAEAFYQKLATNNPNIFSCLGKVEMVEQQFTSSPIFDGLPRPSNDRASGTEGRQRGLGEKETYSRSSGWGRCVHGGVVARSWLLLSNPRVRAR